jgi:hypothetical protein
MAPMIRRQKSRQDDIRKSKEGRRAFLSRIVLISTAAAFSSPPSWLSMSRRWRARRHEHGSLEMETDDIGAVRRKTATVYVSRVLMRFSNRFAAVLVVKLPCLPQEWRILPSTRKRAAGLSYGRSSVSM